jgi:hypothetical protein
MTALILYQRDHQERTLTKLTGVILTGVKLPPADDAPFNR